MAINARYDMGTWEIWIQMALLKPGLSRSNSGQLRPDFSGLFSICLFVCVCVCHPCAGAMMMFPALSQVYHLVKSAHRRLAWPLLKEDTQNTQIQIKRRRLKSGRSWPDFGRLWPGFKRIRPNSAELRPVSRHLAHVPPSSGRFQRHVARAPPNLGHRGWRKYIYPGTLLECLMLSPDW